MATETPSRRAALLYAPFAWAHNERNVEACRDACASNDYAVTAYIQGRPVAGRQAECNLDLFRRELSSGAYGVIHISSHGNREALGVEAFASEADRDRAFARYSAQPEYNGLIGAGGTSNGIPCILIRSAAIRAWSRNEKTIVYVAACNSEGLNQYWNARDRLAYDDQPGDRDATADARRFYERMQGLRDRGERNRSREVRHACAGINHLVHSGNGRTVLAPIVVEWAPEGPLAPNQAANGYVEFDSTVRQGDAAQAITGRGCGIQITNQRWRSPTRLEFSVVLTQGPGQAVMTVVPEHAVSANNGIQLDGNLRPYDQNGVTPNRDEFRWVIPCIVPRDRERRRE